MIYRIVIRNSDDYPYSLQRCFSPRYFSWFNTWKNVEIFKTIGECEDAIGRDMRTYTPPAGRPGKIVRMYDSQDLVAGKLSGKIV